MRSKSWAGRRDKDGSLAGIALARWYETSEPSKGWWGTAKAASVHDDAIVPVDNTTWSTQTLTGCPGSLQSSETNGLPYVNTKFTNRNIVSMRVDVHVPLACYIPSTVQEPIDDDLAPDDRT